MYKGGYTGKILRINLTDQTSKEEALPLEIAKDFIGGAGFGIKYLFDESGTDPLVPTTKLFSPDPFRYHNPRAAWLSENPLSQAPSVWPSREDTFLWS
jgi:aldehyde:ferredoxin oxidoreductase